MEPISFFPALLKMISALALVLGIMIGLAFLFRRFFQQTGLSMPDGAAIRILSVKHLGPKNSIMIVDILGQIIVIGVSQQQMSYITTIDNKEALSRLPSLNGASGEGKGPSLASPAFDRLTDIIKPLIQGVKRRNRP
ncbi:MAG: flagellar biosynthetic protein FliO [Syntrophobacterales bacterium]|jgi:flagellar protein FliO/FliZ|nr:flagellar biosynthetic protein FliO [Syntrophobacterales bacterium]